MRRAALTGLILACGLTATAHTQTLRGLTEANKLSGNFLRDSSLSVRDRRHPEWEAKGVRLRGFVGLPKVTVETGYDDNIFAAQAGATDALVWRVQPAFEAQSQWSRHALNAFARASLNRYYQYGRENSDEWAIGADGRLDFRRDLNLRGQVAAYRITDPRTTAGVPTLTVIPIQYDLTEADLVAFKAFNRLRLTLRGDASRFDFHDGRTAAGGELDQDYRDRKVLKATGRAEYALTPGAAVFVQASADRRDYRLDRPIQPASRDSHGVEVMGGANFELGRKVRGEIGVGYMAQDYRDPAFSRLNGFSGRADLQWYATPLTTLSLTAGRTLEDSGVIGAPGYVSTQVEGRVDHELLRNLILTGKIGAGGERFQGLDRKDRRRLAELAATYQLNRGLGLTLSYTHMDRSSSGLARGDDFDINRVALGLTLRR